MQEKYKRIVEIFVESLRDSLNGIEQSENIDDVIKAFESIEDDSKVVIKILEKLTRVK